jgi:DNA-binding transcriptional LysR family regulator
MNIEHIKLFVRIAALNNISLAGKELGLSPAVSSVHMNKLEKDLGVRLIHRTTRRVSLTEDGEAFLPHAVDLLESFQTARASVGAGSVSPQGKLRVAAPASFGRMHLMPALSGFLQRYPELRVDMHLSDHVMDMVEGGFDIAIRDASLQDSSLIARKLAPVHRVLCASPDYLSRNGEPLKPEDLLDHQCINLIGLETWVFETPEGPKSIKTNNRFRTDNGEAARDACSNGIGITISSTWCCYQQLQSGELVEVMKDYPLVSNTAIWAVYPSSRLLAPKVRAFIDYLAGCFTQTPYWEEGLNQAIIARN